jgi:hypothetical protein
VDWIDKRFKGRCISRDDPFEEHVVALAFQRGYDSALIPVWDMVNHRNGWVNTENNSVWAGNGLKVRASKRIEKGKEIFASYDECLDCGHVSDDWGTPEILRDFGFVESYQQRWVFPKQRIWFEIDELNHEDGDDSPKLMVEWDIADDPQEDAYGIPDEVRVAFLREELKRLNSASEAVLKEQGNVTTNEWDIILQYHQAATVAISTAIDSAASFKDQEL